MPRADVEAAVDMLAAAERPVLYTGGGVINAGPAASQMLRELQRRLPQVRLWNFYGQTEIAPLATVLKPEDQLRKAGSAGRAAP